MLKVVELTKSQSIFVGDNTSKAIALVTGFGGGKTFALVTKMVKMKHDFPKADLLYLLPTFSMFRDILFPTLIEVIEGTGIGYRINKSTGEIFFDCGGRVILKSMDNPESIVGMNVLAVFLDELDTLQYDKAWQVWIKALARARKLIKVVDENGVPVLDKLGEQLEVVNQMIVGSTPEGFRLLYKLFEKEKPDNYTLVQASGYENIHLPKDYYDNLKQIYPAELVEAYINGRFVNMTTGAVYKEFDRVTCDSDAQYIGEDLGKGISAEEVTVSMDFNVMNMNAVAFVQREKVFLNNTFFKYEGKPSYHAVRHFKGIKDTPEMILELKKAYPKSKILVYPDASGRNTSSKGFTVSDISLLKDAGFRVKAPSKNPRILDRVQSVNSAFKTGLIKVNVVKCPEVAEALEQQVFDPKTELPEKSSTTSIDDINDSFGYFIDYKYPIKKKSMKKKQIRGM